MGARYELHGIKDPLVYCDRRSRHTRNRPKGKCVHVGCGGRGMVPQRVECICQPFQPTLGLLLGNGELKGMLLEVGFFFCETFVASSQGSGGQHIKGEQKM